MYSDIEELNEALQKYNKSLDAENKEPTNSVDSKQSNHVPNVAKASQVCSIL